MKSGRESRGGGWCVCVCGGGGQPFFISPTRTALHTISIGLQNSFCESHKWRPVSWKAPRALNARWAVPVYLVFEDENSNESNEKSVKQKIALKKTNRTNIIATNLVSEQLKRRLDTRTVVKIHMKSCFWFQSVAYQKRIEQLLSTFAHYESNNNTVNRLDEYLTLKTLTDKITSKSIVRILLLRHWKQNTFHL